MLSVNQEIVFRISLANSFMQAGLPVFASVLIAVSAVLPLVTIISILGRGLLPQRYRRQ